MVENLPANAGDTGERSSILSKSGRSSGEEYFQSGIILDPPLQYSCLENPMDRGAWQATVHGVAKSQTQFSDQATTI